jgi:hypothetical protein
VVDMETGAVLVAEIHAADQGDTATLEPNLEDARAKPSRPTTAIVRELVVPRGVR